MTYVWNEKGAESVKQDIAADPVVSNTVGDDIQKMVREALKYADDTDLGRHITFLNIFTIEKALDYLKADYELRYPESATKGNLKGV